MKPRRRGLARGLDALLGDRDASSGAAREQRLLQVPVDAIRRGDAQPRRDLDKGALEELSRSIRAQGVVQPVVVRADGKGYELIAGERRWRAAQLAGLRVIPAVLHEVDDHTAACLALVENIQRRDLNPVEEAQALERLVREPGMTHESLAASVGRSRAAVSNLVRLLSLAPGALELLRRERLSTGHAKVLLALPPARQEQLAREVSERELSVRDTERLVRRLLAGSGARKPGQRSRAASGDPDIERLERDLSERLAARVRIRGGAKGKGMVQIHYNSPEELEGILGRIG